LYNNTVLLTINLNLYNANIYIFIKLSMEGLPTSASSAYNLHQNSTNFSQGGLYQLLLSMNQKINNIEEDKKKNEDKVTQMNAMIISMKNQMFQEESKHKNEINYLNFKMLQEKEKNKNDIIYLKNEINYLNFKMLQEEDKHKNDIIYLNNILAEQKNQINYLNYKIFQGNKQINQIQANNKNEKILFELKYEQKFKEIEDLILNLEKNYSNVIKEISSFKIVKEMVSSILSLLEEIIKEIRALYEKQKINEKNYQETNDKISTIVSEVSKLSEKINNNYEPNFNSILSHIENLLNQIEEMNKKYNYRIKNLENEVDQLKKKNIELQKIIISRKLIKIIIKYIIIYSIKNFTLENNSCKLNNLEMKYSQLNREEVKEIINFLIAKNREINFKLHMEGGIDKIIELLNSYGTKITFNDLLDIMQFDDNRSKLIKKIMEITNLSNLNIYYDIVGADTELKEMLLELQNELNDCK